MSAFKRLAHLRRSKAANPIDRAISALEIIALCEVLKNRSVYQSLDMDPSDCVRYLIQWSKEKIAKSDAEPNGR
ncbi:MAG: hypothetical protein M3447_11250 [Acidobacteriota bacterium]|nr:hypothetical protein [Acidobacteriota bacterium]